LGNNGKYHTQNANSGVSGTKVIIKNTWGATSLQAAKTMVRCELNGDNRTILDMLSRGELFKIDKGTKYGYAHFENKIEYFRGSQYIVNSKGHSWKDGYVAISIEGSAEIYWVCTESLSH
jgi:hypothetical protein